MAKYSKYLYETDLGLPLFESQGEYHPVPSTAAPHYREITSPECLRCANQIVQDLRVIDWSFTLDDTAFLTHDIHPYPSKYIPQIPGHMIARLSLRGELVFDPFGGSGTTALEAVRLGRRAISVDANPVGTLIGKVKTCNLDESAAVDLHALKCALAGRVCDLPNEPETLCREYASFVPEMPNIDKWFPLSSRGELALIRSRIDGIESEKAKDIARLAMSRIVLAVSFQDSETRYASKPREIPIGETIRRFLIALDQAIRSITTTQPVLRHGVCEFVTGDSRNLGNDICKSNAIDLIVTSPPYGNANDYHLYHRFRLMWLGHDPRRLARIEIGSHLRHQRDSTGFDAYLSEMRDSLSTMYRSLRPGRYAVLVVGDPVYGGVLHKGAESLSDIAERIGFEPLCIIERDIHSTKRSFVSAGRRATTEKLLILRKPTENLMIWLQAPPYKLWPYEAALRQREIASVLGIDARRTNVDTDAVSIDPYCATETRRLVFTYGFGPNLMDLQPTWQSIVENGFAFEPSVRKDPKYVTHGLHPYKGKFYPQLAKALINLCRPAPGSNILDPFCGSGTTLLEGHLNGYRTYGCDVHPLAARIARAKVRVLEVNPDVLRATIGTLIRRIEQSPSPSQFPDERDQFAEDSIEEIEGWFPNPVVRKLNWLLRAIHGGSDGILTEFLEVVLSSIVRDVSQQNPSDLRVRRRKVPIEDADVLGLYTDALDRQYERIAQFWSVRGYSPHRFLSSNAFEGDSRLWKTFEEMRLGRSSIDMILTSPPYATALPYIDTDRLSLLLLFGINSSKRRPLERNLVGSREISTRERTTLEQALTDTAHHQLPESVKVYLKDLFRRISVADVGFRRKNMPALLLRFFADMEAVLRNCHVLLKPQGEAMIVIGDNRMRVGEEYERIPTTDFVQEIAVRCGFTLAERIDISVTTENLLHARNAITENVVLRLKRS